MKTYDQLKFVDVVSQSASLPGRQSMTYGETVPNWFQLKLKLG